MIYHGLPVIPEDDVLDVVTSYPNQTHRIGKQKSSRNGAASNTNTGIHNGINDDSPFGYVAILRNDTLLIEVGHSVMEILDGIDDIMDCDAASDEGYLNTRSASLDETILGLLQKDPVPEWDHYNCGHDSSGTNLWTGIRFHCYDEDDSLSSKAITTVWSFCVVYRHGGEIQERTIQQWMMQHLVQFTLSFRQNDVIWKTGPTLSCQYIFAPVLQQRMLVLLPETLASTDSHHADGSTVDWMNVASAIIARNHEIFTHLTTTGVTPFVSDESDNDDDEEDSCEPHNESLEEEMNAANSLEYDDSETSSSDEDDELLLTRTPKRTGALPINYFYNNRNEGSDGITHPPDHVNYLDRIMATTNSIWANHSVAAVPPTTSYVTSKAVSKTIPLENQSDKTDPPAAPKMIHDKSTLIRHRIVDSDDDDDDTIPLICFVGDQVDAQHSDLWKRSPKSISKAEALGIANTVVSQQPQKQQELKVAVLHPTRIDASPSSTQQQQNTEQTMLKSLTSNHKSKEWWEFFALKASVTLGLVWNNIIVRFDNKNHIDDHDRTMKHQKEKNHPCFWCESIFPPKVSAMQ